MIKYIISISMLLVFSGCFNEEKPKQKRIKKTTKATEYLAKKVNNDTNASLIDTIEDDGIVIDGARDEKLLIAFDKAVSQVIMEEGVSVPDCDALSKTDFLTLEECKEITEKYFGFYEINLETGEANKVDDIFKSGISGKGVDIRDSEVDLFDSSGNPLLENLVEFEELVDNSEDVGMLKNLNNKIPESKKVLKEKVEKRIEFLEATNDYNQKVVNQNDKTVEKKEQDETISSGQSNNNDETSYNQKDINSEALEEAKASLSSAYSRLDNLYIKHRKTEQELNQYPNSEKLIEEYNEQLIEIAQAQSDIEYYQSLVESLSGN